MRIEIHPKPDGMQHINFMFCNEEPEPEDIWVRERMEGFRVPPKRILQWERDGKPYQVLQYGQCVLGDVMFYIEKHKGVVDKIRRCVAQNSRRRPYHVRSSTSSFRRLLWNFNNRPDLSSMGAVCWRLMSMKKNCACESRNG